MPKVQIKKAIGRPKGVIMDAKVTALIEHEIKADLERRAKQEDRTVSYCVRAALIEYLK